MTACLRHTAHPFQLCTIQIIGTRNFRIGRIDTLLTLLEVVTVISFIRINLLVVYFDDFRADTIEEITVVRHHQQAQIGTVQVFFQPFGHIEIQVVGRLVQNQQVRFGNQDIRQCHTLELSSRKILDFLIEMTDF